MIYPPPSYSALSPPFSFRLERRMVVPAGVREVLVFTSTPSNAVLSLTIHHPGPHHSHSIYLPCYLSIYPLQLFHPLFFFCKDRSVLWDSVWHEEKSASGATGTGKQKKKKEKKPLRILSLNSYFLFCEGRSRGSSLQNLGKQAGCSRRQQRPQTTPPKVINQLTFIFLTVLQPLTRLNIHPTPWLRRRAALLLPHFLCV